MLRTIDLSTTEWIGDHWDPTWRLGSRRAGVGSVKGASMARHAEVLSFMCRAHELTVSYARLLYVVSNGALDHVIFKLVFALSKVAINWNWMKAAASSF